MNIVRVIETLMMTESKKVSESRTTLTEIVLPDHANPLGYLRGGKLVDWMDIAAEVAAQRHAGLPAVTVSLDRMTFTKPILVGDIVTITAQVTRAFETSMEIWVEVFKENHMSRKASQQEPVKTNEAFFVFVTIDKHGDPVKIPGIIPETEYEQQLYKSALQRKEAYKI